MFMIRCCIARTENRMDSIRARGMRARGPATQKNAKRRPPMHQVFIEGGLIRKLWSVETDAYRDHLLRLDAESRRNRFNATIADDTVRGFAATARGSDVILHGFFVDGVLRGVADLRILGGEAEAAFSIEKRWQSHGVGSALLERSLLAARNQGAKLLQVCCLVDNYRM